MAAVGDQLDLCARHERGALLAARRRDRALNELLEVAEGVGRPRSPRAAGDQDDELAPCAGGGLRDPLLERLEAEPDLLAEGRELHPVA